ncbi:MAG: hypothetical protein EOM67_07735 [Spirochaetia bacterium]|nr:hypothetical protein [Spirochaetia bacterium]
MLNQWLGKVLDTVHSFVFGGKEISDRTLLFTSLGLCVGTYFILMQLVRLGVEFLYKLPI